VAPVSSLYGSGVDGDLDVIGLCNWTNPLWLFDRDF
jgi:hypothetical protein